MSVYLLKISNTHEQIWNVICMYILFVLGFLWYCSSDQHRNKIYTINFCMIASGSPNLASSQCRKTTITLHVFQFFEFGVLMRSALNFGMYRTSEGSRRDDEWLQAVCTVCIWIRVVCACALEFG